MSVLNRYVISSFALALQIYLYSKNTHNKFQFTAQLSGIGVYISRVEEGSVAERSGLKPGDTILEVNGTPFSGMTHDEALTVNDLSFVLLPPPKIRKMQCKSILL